MSVYMTRENARREKLFGSADSAMLREGDEKSIAEYDAQQTIWGLDNKTELEIGALGDHHPGFSEFRFTFIRFAFLGNRSLTFALFLSA